MPRELGLHVSWPAGEGQEQARAGVVWVGASPSPPSPCCTLMVVEGEGGRVPGCRCTFAGDCSYGAGEARGGGTAPGPSCYPFLSVV